MLKIPNTSPRFKGPVTIALMSFGALAASPGYAALIDGDGLTTTAYLCIGESCALENGAVVGENVEAYQLDVGKSGDFSLGDQEAIVRDDSGRELKLENLSGNSDPVIVAALSGVDPIGGGSFLAAIIAPLVGFTPGTAFTSTCNITGGFSDGGDGTVGNSAFATPGNLQECTLDGIPINVAGPPVPAGTATTVPSTGAVGGVLGYGPLSNTVNGVCPVGGCVAFDLAISLTNQAGPAGANDGFALTGTHVITIDEPSAAALMSLGLLSIATPAWRRRRANASAA